MAVKMEMTNYTMFHEISVGLTCTCMYSSTCLKWSRFNLINLVYSVCCYAQCVSTVWNNLPHYCRDYALSTGIYKCQLQLSYVHSTNSDIIVHYKLRNSLRETDNWLLKICRQLSGSSSLVLADSVPMLSTARASNTSKSDAFTFTTLFCPPESRG